MAFRCGQAPRLSWPCARYSPAHGVNAGRDTSDMASTCKGSMCEGPHVGPHDTRGPQCVARDPYTEAAASGRHIRDLGLRQLAPLHLGWCLCGVRVRAPPVQRHNPPPNPVNLQSMKPCCEGKLFRPCGIPKNRCSQPVVAWQVLVAQGYHTNRTHTLVQYPNKQHRRSSVNEALIIISLSPLSVFLAYAASSTHVHVCILW